MSSAAAPLGPAAAARERDLLIEAVLRAAPIAGALFRPGAPAAARSWRKSDGSVVTEADLAVNAALKEHPLSARPDYGWLSEEEAEREDPAQRLGRGPVFILDPIDGTRSFLEGSEVYCHSVALAVGGAVVAAAVLAPAMGRLYDAALGAGARLEGRALATRPAAPAEPPRAMAPKRDLKGAVWEQGPPPVERLYMQPIAHRLCAVAAGEADGLIALRDTQEWDIAAADLIAREAGLTVTDRAGAPHLYNKADPTIPGVLAAPADLHRAWLLRGPRPS